MSLSADDAKRMAFTLMTYADLMESAYALTTWISVDNFKKLVLSYLVNLVNDAGYNLVYTHTIDKYNREAGQQVKLKLLREGSYDSDDSDDDDNDDNDNTESVSDETVS